MQDKSGLSDKARESSLVAAIRKGQMKEIQPRKFSNNQLSGSFKTWAKEIKDYVYWHDAQCKALIDHFEEDGKRDEKLEENDVIKYCTKKGMDVAAGVAMDTALHMVIGAFLEGEAKILSESGEVMDVDGSSRKSGLELWRLLNYNYDRSSPFNIIGLVEFIRSIAPAKTTSEISAKLAALDHAHQEYCKLARASKDEEFQKMITHGIKVYSEVFKKTDLLKILPETLVK